MFELMERNGKWTTVEEDYADKLIELFNAGQLPYDVEDGETLRVFLSKKLSCKPTRLTKKYGHRKILAIPYKVNEIPNENNFQERQIIDDLREIFLSKDAKVQMIRKKRKKYLKGSSLASIETLKINNNDVEEMQIDDMFSFSWEGFDDIPIDGDDMDV
mmetsp:Transcript_11554/g.11572  ORF Transcript_11554/g.11572 Transcript_11554/m.11572 type:complete len:159 (-) Transcript_11554:363-839(-)